VSSDPAGTLWFEAGSTVMRCLNRLDPTNGELVTTPEDIGEAAATDGAVWFTSATSVTRRAADGVQATFDVGATIGIAGLRRPITVDPAGRAWVSLTGDDAIARIGADGQVDRFADGIPAGAMPGTIVAGADGTVWFAQPGAGRIGRTSADGAITSVEVGGTPTLVAAGPDASAWFVGEPDETGAATGAPGRIAADGTVTRYDDVVLDGPVIDLAVAADGAVWLAEATGVVGRLGSDGSFAEWPLVPAPNTFETGFHHPESITFDADGTAWVSVWFYGGEYTSILLFAVVVGERPDDWVGDLPLDRPIGRTPSTCGSGAAEPGAPPTTPSETTTTTADPAPFPPMTDPADVTTTTTDEPLTTRPVPPPLPPNPSSTSK
jgi:virginiamycin B lyase